MHCRTCLLLLAFITLASIRPTSATAERPLLIGGTVALDAGQAAAAEAALLPLARSGVEAERYAVTAIDDLGDFSLLSVAGLANLPADEQWYLAKHAVWLGLILIERQPDGHLLSAAAGSERFSAMLQRIPDDQLTAAAKADLDPRNPRPRSTAFQLPWQPGTAMRFGTRGLHSADWGSTLPGWQAVDLVSAGNVGSGQAPNLLLTAGYGTRGYRCADDTSVAVVIGDFLYAHLIDNWRLQTPGAEFHVGDELGSMKTGGFDDRCGYAYQSPTSFHVHFGFADRATLPIGSWLFDLDAEQWHHESEGVIDVGGWIYNDGGEPDSSPPSGGFGYPTDGLLVSSALINLSAWAWDDNGVRSLTFEAAWEGRWRTLHTEYYAPYTYYFDLCAWEIPDGPIELNLEVVDYGGNRYRPPTPLRIQKQVICEPPHAPQLSRPATDAAITEGDDIVLEWQPVANASQYLVEWSDGAGTSAQPCGWSSASSCSIGRPAPGHTISWRVMARNSVGDSSWSETRRFSVWSALSVSEPLTLNPLTPYALGPATARFSVRNDGAQPLTLKNLLVAVRSPGCVQWHCDDSLDFASIEAITVQPGDVYQYEQRRSFATAAADHVAFVAFQDSSGSWFHDALRNNAPHTFDVERGIELVTPLQLNPLAPALAKPVDATFRVRNAASRPITLQTLGVLVRGPHCAGWECTAKHDFDLLNGVTLQPGQELQYSEQQTFAAEGGGYLARIGLTHSDGSNDYLGATLNFAVAAGLQVENTLTLDGAAPTAGRAVRAAYTVTNSDDQPLTIARLGVSVSRTDCESRSCMDQAGFATVGPLTLQPGQSLRYEKDGVFNDSGIWTIEPAFLDEAGAWQAIANGRRRSVNVAAGLSLDTALTLTPSAPLAGELVSGRLVLRNDSSGPVTLTRLFTLSGGPGCIDALCSRRQESNVVSNITLAAGAYYVYQVEQLYQEAGSGYFIQPYYQFAGEATPVPLGRAIDLTVSAGLTIETALSANPLDPLRQQQTTFAFSVANQGNRALTLPPLAVRVSGPGCPAGGCLTEPTAALTLAAGTSLTIVQKQRFAAIGSYSAEPVSGGAEAWRSLPGTAQLAFSVKPVPQLPNRLYLPAIREP